MLFISWLLVTLLFVSPFRLNRKIYYERIPRSYASVGIDLGTTNSLVSIMKDGKPIIIPSGSGNLVPSVVSFLNSGKVMVGRSAKLVLDSSEQDSLRQNTFSSIKRLMGKTKVDLENANVDKALLKRLSSSVDQNHNVLLQCPHRPAGIISPEDISTLIIRKLIGIAHDYLQSLGMESNITNAVITVPAYFNMRQREATERAGLRAGLTKVKLITEPEAAALAYSLSNNDLKQVVMVLDLGGGTFDVSFLEVGQGITETLITGGDANLGGDDFDYKIYQYLLKQYASHHSIKDSDNYVLKHMHLRNELHRLASEAKTNLTTVYSVNITIPAVDGLSEITVPLTRSKFEGICTDLYERLRLPIIQCATGARIDLPGLVGAKMDRDGVPLDQYDTIDWGSVTAKSILDDPEVHRLNLIELKKRQRQGKKNFRQRRHSKTKINGTYVSPESFEEQLAHLKPVTTIHEVVLVGGATRMPGVINMVKKLVGCHPLRTLNPDEAVCLGAGVMAGILDGHVGEMRVVTQMESALIRFLAQEKLKGNTELFEWIQKSMNTDKDEGDEKTVQMLSDVKDLAPKLSVYLPPEEEQDDDLATKKSDKKKKLSVFKRSSMVKGKVDAVDTAPKAEKPKVSVFRRKSTIK